MEIAVALIGVIVAVVVFRLVAGEDRTHEATATEEMWNRSLKDYQRNAGHGVTTVTRERDRIAESPATIKHNALKRV